MKNAQPEVDGGSELGRWLSLAEQVLRGEPLGSEQCLDILRAAPEETLGLMLAAERVRQRFFGRDVIVHVLNNAKSGMCSEDCGFCSQAARFHTGVEQYAVKTHDEIVAGARQAHRLGARTYCIVTSTRNPARHDLEVLCGAVATIKGELPLRVCVSVGFLSDAHAQRLRAAGVDRYNHNLEASRRYFPNVVGSHSFDDRVETIRRAKAVGMEICSGGIIGMGETLADRVDLALTLRELRVDSVPVNFLDPRPGTPLADAKRPSPDECLRALAMFRLCNPTVDVRVAGGREANLRMLQPLALCAATSIFVNGYLTTGGQGHEADFQMIADMGYRVSHVEPS